MPASNERLLESREPKSGVIMCLVVFMLRMDIYALGRDSKESKEFSDKLAGRLGLEPLKSCFLDSTFGLYCRYVAKPCVDLVGLCMRPLLILGFLSFIPSLMYVALMASDLVLEPRNLHTFQAVEKNPAVKILVPLCAHLFYCILLLANRATLARGQNPPVPVLYALVVGKGFLLIRMAMSYSSGVLSSALEYFVYQEIILIVYHSVLSTLIAHTGGPDPSLEEVRSCMGRILFIDASKTVIMLFVWLNFRPGPMAQIFDRLPTQQSQIVIALLVHLYMDLLQSASTSFTVYMGNWFHSVRKKRAAKGTKNNPEPLTNEIRV